MKVRAISGPTTEAELIRALGADHPLARAERAVTVATSLAIDASVLLAAAPSMVLAGRGPAIAACASAALVAGGLWAGVVVTRALRRRCVHDRILDGSAPRIPLILSEMERLVAPGRRIRVAQTLLAALHAGEHWYEQSPASRPPAGVRNLPPNAELIREIATCLGDGVASPRGMVMLDRLVEGGYGAALYRGGPEWVSRELGRIRFTLHEPY